MARRYRSIVMRPMILVFFMVLVFFYFQYISKAPSEETNLVSSGIQTHRDEDLAVSSIFLPRSGSFESESLSYLETFKNLEPENIIVAVYDSGSEGVSVSFDIKENVKNKLETIDLRFDGASDVFFSKMGGVFEGSSIIPLIIGNGVGSDSIATLVDELYGSLNERRTLMVLALEFPSISPSVGENQMLFVQNMLMSSNTEKTERTGEEIGGIASLGMLWAEKLKTKQFNLDASKCINNKCFVRGYYNKGNMKNIEPSTVFTVGGDMMFDRGVNYRFPEDRIFDSASNIQSLFYGTDLSVVNLEGPISPVPIDNELSYSMSFNFPPKTTDVLKRLKINAVSLANNHTNNNGPIGLSNTKKVLKDNGITTIGEERTFNEESIARFSGGYLDISVIVINYLEVARDLSEAIKSEKSRGNYVIIFPHWGVEYESLHSKSQENLAHSWVDAGADLVIGTHPHVIQDAEVYKNKPIFYSLGNLLFDQTWSEPTQKGLVLSGVISSRGTRIVLVPTKSVGLKPTILDNEEKMSALQKFDNILAKAGSDVLLLKP